MALSSPCNLCTSLLSLSCQPGLPLHEPSECGSNPYALSGAWVSITCMAKRPKGVVKRMTLRFAYLRILAAGLRASSRQPATAFDVFFSFAASTIRAQAPALERLNDGSRQRRTPTGREDEERPIADIIELARQYGRCFYHSR